MALNGTGPISLGGSTTGESVNLELGVSATATISFNDATVRALTETTSGTALIMPTNLYSKAYTDTQVVTVGYVEYKGGARQWGFRSGLAVGSINDGTFGLRNNATISDLFYSTITGSIDFILTGNVSNDKWTKMTINGNVYNRSSATYNYDGTYSSWSWATATNEFGTTVGATKTVVFTK